jgi:hypothetical protein
MKLELLKKLVKLANSNPNEFEANSAARRVCQLLEKDDFVISYVEFNQKTQTPPRKSTVSDEEYDRTVDKMWEDLFKRTNHPK